MTKKSEYTTKLFTNLIPENLKNNNSEYYLNQIDKVLNNYPGNGFKPTLKVFNGDNSTNHIDVSKELLNTLKKSFFNLTVEVYKWQDINGNTYHSIYIFSNHALLGYNTFDYGYGNHYVQTTLTLLKQLEILPEELDYTDFNKKYYDLINWNDNGYQKSKKLLLRYNH